MSFGSARRYIDDRVHFWADQIVPGKLVTTRFKRMKVCGALTTVYKLRKRREIIVAFDTDLIRANVHNIKNKFFDDMIVHELSHVDEIERDAAAAIATKTMRRFFPHKRKSFRERVRKYTGSVVPSLGSLDEQMSGDYMLYYGGNKYGYVPANILKGHQFKCNSCGDTLIAPEKKKHRCNLCGGKTIPIKKVSPRTVMLYIVKHR